MNAEWPAMTTKHKRLSIPVTPEVEASFARLAEATGVSVSKAMGDWLADTLEGVDAMANIISQAKGDTLKAARNMSAYAESLTLSGAEALDSLLKVAEQHKKAAQLELQVRETTAAAMGKARRAAGVTPPVSNTGGKVQNKKNPKGG